MLIRGFFSKAFTKYSFLVRSVGTTTLLDSKTDTYVIICVYVYDLDITLIKHIPNYISIPKFRFSWLCALFVFFVTGFFCICKFVFCFSTSLCIGIAVNIPCSVMFLAMIMAQ